MRVPNAKKIMWVVFAAMLMLLRNGLAEEVASRSFIADRTARIPGDTLTVLISEIASTSTTATTRLAKNDKAGVSVTSPASGTRNWGAGVNNDFEGGGEIERGNRFTARLSVTVKEIDSQGNLHVEGEQEIAVNRERQHIRLTGIVRQEDLSAQNTIESWRIRDAKIEFIGNGDLARRQTPSLMSRILSWFRIF